MVGGAGEGYSGDDDMIKREDLVTEQKLRSYIREKIESNLKEHKQQILNEEAVLRSIIRSIISEADVSDIHPHRSTGINVLEDLLKILQFHLVLF